MVEKKFKDKAALVAELQDKLNRSSAVVITEYRGLKAGDLVRLRSSLREAQVELRVVKNTLLRRATEGSPLADAVKELEGPSAVAFAFGESADGVKKLSQNATTYEPLVLKRGLVELSLLSGDEIEAYAKLPGKQELRAKVVGTLQGPLAGLVFTLQGVLTQFAGTLQAKIDKEGGA